MRTVGVFGGGEDDAPPDPELQTALALETAKASGDGADGASVTAKLITMLPRLFFETRKDAAAVFNAIVRHPVDVARRPAARASPGREPPFCCSRS